MQDAVRVDELNNCVLTWKHSCLLSSTAFRGQRIRDSFQIVLAAAGATSTMAEATSTGLGLG